MVRLNFYRRLPLIPGLIYLNVSRRSLSLSVRGRGVGVTFGRRGISFSAGLVGTGISARVELPFPKVNSDQDVQLNNNNDTSHRKFLGGADGQKEIER
ncbi:DUF4236 domain-containing protein [Microbulbifer sp. SA54]|uniref:DUF4236 domain-containing protein n=1 Tax=Microbulbifer sp. SA54 TaxID=3401577 RepID=UPI003AAD61AC